MFVAVLSTEFPFHQSVALAVFVLASITDYVDGELARRYALITNFGKLMDPLVDKIMTAAAFVCLVPLKAIPAWVAVVVITREFLITGLRLLAVSKGRILAADPIGKHKTSWQIATIIFFLTLGAYQEVNLHRTGMAAGPVWQRALAVRWLDGQQRGRRPDRCTRALITFGGTVRCWRRIDGTRWSWVCSHPTAQQFFSARRAAALECAATRRRFDPSDTSRRSPSASRLSLSRLRRNVGTRRVAVGSGGAV